MRHEWDVRGTLLYEGAWQFIGRAPGLIKYRWDSGSYSDAFSHVGRARIGMSRATISTASDTI